MNQNFQAIDRITATVGELPSLIGVELGPSSWRAVGQNEVDRFAELTGDHGRIHTDPDFAATTRFGTTIVPGYQTLALVVPLMEEIFAITDAVGVINYGLDRVRFPAPVPVGSRIRVRAEISSVEETGGAVQVRYRTTIELEGSQKPAAAAERIMRYTSAAG